jgi:hypothetical protein
MRNLSEEEPLDAVWDEMVFTESRLKGDERTKELAPVATTAIGQIDETRTGLLGVRRNEVAAHAAVSAADNQLDDWICDFDRSLINAVRGDKESAGYRRYFKNARWTYVRMGLESELSEVRGWVASLATEPDQVLKDHGVRLAALVVAGDAVLEQRRAAISARSDFRVRKVIPLVSQMNAARGTLYGALVTKAAQAGLPSDWPNRFFKQSVRTSKTVEEVPPDPNTPSTK